MCPNVPVMFGSGPRREQHPHGGGLFGDGRNQGWEVRPAEVARRQPCDGVEGVVLVGATRRLLGDKIGKAVHPRCRTMPILRSMMPT